MSRPEGQALFDDLAEVYQGRDDFSRKAMFGSAALCHHDKIVGFVDTDGGMIVKLTEARADELVVAGHATRVTIGRGQAREWVSVPLERGEYWAEVLEEAVERSG